MINATSTQLRKAADAMEKIQSLQEELSQVLGGSRLRDNTGEFPHGNILRQAAGIQDKIGALKKECNQLLGSPAPVQTAAPEAPKEKGKISAAGIARIVAANKARWAKIKASTPSARPAPTPKRKFSARAIANIRAGVARRMAAQAKAVQKPRIRRSAAWRAAVSASAKARWARAKKAGRNRL